MEKAGDKSKRILLLGSIIFSMALPLLAIVFDPKAGLHLFPQQEWISTLLMWISYAVRPIGFGFLVIAAIRYSVKDYLLIYLPIVLYGISTMFFMIEYPNASIAVFSWVRMFILYLNPLLIPYLLVFLMKRKLSEILTYSISCVIYFVYLRTYQLLIPFVYTPLLFKLMNIARYSPYVITSAILQKSLQLFVCAIIFSLLTYPMIRILLRNKKTPQ